MKLEVLRMGSFEKYTAGGLYEHRPEGRRLLCFTLEDEFRTQKVSGETRIPPGEYRITLRREGGHHHRYAQRFPNIHRGMLWIRDVPNFEYILIHIGNTESDTAGCLLVGMLIDLRTGLLGASKDAYQQFYPPVAAAIERGEEVTIRYTNYDSPPEVFAAA